MENNIKTILKDKTETTVKDVVGLEIGSGHNQGVPAVRLRTNRGKTELLAAGFVNLDDKLPQNPEALDKPSGSWSLPKEFHAPKAAVAVTSPAAILRQTSETNSKGEEKLTHRRAFMETDKDYPPLLSSMPDFLAAWVAQRFPEGHRPTTRSIQTSSAAAINCFLTGPVPQENPGAAITVFCFKNYSSIVAFFKGNLVLYREHPVGYMTIKEEISKSMNIDIAMVDSLIDDSVIDISSIITPPLNALFRQVDISSDYISRRKNCPIENFYIYGLPGGVKHWTKTFRNLIKKPLHHLHPFGGISCSSRKLHLPESFERDAPLFTTAVGAAKALLEDT
ncbi:MAG: hypothetical protein R6V06_08485 [Kiritimatiellia bacterium]